METTQQDFPLLDDFWKVEFMVKFRQQEGSRAVYKKNDFYESFVRVGAATNSLSELLHNISRVPSVNIRERGILTIFRDGIDPLWEHPKNYSGSIIRFQMMKKQPSPEELDSLKLRKLGPVIEDQESVFLLFLTLVVYNHFRIPGQFNGIYFKIENNYSTLELWGSAQDSAKQAADYIQLICDYIPYSSTYATKKDVIEVNLLKTLTITTIKNGITHGRSVYPELNPELGAAERVVRASSYQSEAPKNEGEGYEVK